MSPGIKTSTCQALLLILILNWVLLWGESEGNLLLHFAHQYFSKLTEKPKSLRKGYILQNILYSVFEVNYQYCLCWAEVLICFYFVSVCVRLGWCDDETNTSCVSVRIWTHGNRVAKGGLISGWRGDTRLHRGAFGGYESEEPGARLGRDGRLSYLPEWDGKYDARWPPRRIKMMQTEQDSNSNRSLSP